MRNTHNTNRFARFARLTSVGTLAGFTAFAAIGCSSSDDSQTASDADYDDVAQALGSVAATDSQGGEVGSIYDATSISVGLPAVGLVVSGAGQIKTKRLGVDYSYNTECKNESGTVTEKCDATTDSATVNVNWSGDLKTSHIAASIDHQGELNLTDIKSGTINVSGDGSFDYDATFKSLFRDVERSYHLSYTTEYSALEVSGIPLSIKAGSIHYVIDAERKVSRDDKEKDAKFHIDATLTFETDGGAKLTLDESHSYVVNTTTGMVTKS